MQPIVYYVLKEGMVEPLRRLMRQTSTVQFLLDTPVTGVSRNAAGGFQIHCANGPTKLVDDLVFATPAEISRQLLRTMTGTAGQELMLSRIEFHDTRIAIHTDPVYAPSDPNYRSFLNCRVAGNFCEASMWMSGVLGSSPSAAKLWKSWVTHRPQQPAQVLHEVNFRHMLPTPSSIAAQAGLSAMQGAGGVWFAGGYTFPYDSQETALLSAVKVAWGLQASPARTGLLRTG